jgi:hypothetical protein
MGEIYVMQEPDRGDCKASETQEETRDDFQRKDETNKSFEPEWFSLMPREVADQAITRGIICQYMLVLA